MASSRALTTASGFMKLLRSHHSPQLPTPFNARSLRSVAFLKSGSETNSGSKSNALTTATGLVKLLRSHLSPQMLTPFSARSLRTVAFPTSSSKANSDSESEALTIVTGLVKLLHSHLSPQMATPFTARSLHTVAHPTSGSDTDTDSDSDYESDADSSSSSKRCYILIDCPLANRFLRGGSKLAYDVKEDEEAKYARVDMPGIGKEAVKVWAEKNALMIKGDESSDEETARSYFGAIELAEGRYMVDQIKAELKNGVLKVVIPKVKFEDRNDVFPVKVE